MSTRFLDNNLTSTGFFESRMGEFTTHLNTFGSYSLWGSNNMVPSRDHASQISTLKNRLSQDEADISDIVIPDLTIDIDTCDSRNPLAVVDYIDDLYDHYRRTENSSCVPPNYMLQQSEINEEMREFLVEWLIMVHHDYGLNAETLFLMVNIIDRFLARQLIKGDKLQLVGVTAMLLATKYEEGPVIPIERLIQICGNTYTRKEFLDMEKLMVKTLNFNMSVPTPYVFMARFLKAALSDKQLELLSFFIIEQSLISYEMLKYPPSLLASAAIYTASCTIHKFRFWSWTIQRHSGYSEDQLQECSRLMVSLHQQARMKKIHPIFDSYRMKYSSVANYEPALFLLGTQY